MTNAIRVAGLSFVLVVAVGCGGSPSTDPSTDKPKPGASTTPDFKLAALDLAKEYESDKDAAEKKYKDKIVEVDGVVFNSPTARMDDAVVIIANYKADPKKIIGRMVMASSTKEDRQKVLKLSKDQTVKLRGKVFGDFAGNVSLAECMVVEAGPDPSIKVSAADLTKAYATDEKSATDKYNDKMVVVDGTFVEVRKGDIVDTVILEGFDEKSDKPVRVSGGIPADQKQEFAALKKGDKVTIKGEQSGFFPDNAGRIVNINGVHLVK
jgi:hypothetical protein